MTKSKVAGVIIGSILIVAGVVWSLMFPKTKDILRPDFVASVAIGVGLIIPGFIILFLKKHRMVSSILSMFLIWSILMNLFLFSFAKYSVNVIRKMTEDGSNAMSKRSEDPGLLSFLTADTRLRGHKFMLIFISEN